MDRSGGSNVREDWATEIYKGLVGDPPGNRRPQVLKVGSSSGKTDISRL